MKDRATLTHCHVLPEGLTAYPAFGYTLRSNNACRLPFQRRFNMRTKREKSCLILTRFAMHSFPRFRGGSFSNFIGWSKPRIEIYEIKETQANEPICFANRQLEVVEIEAGEICFRFIEPESQNASAVKSEIKKYALNKPVSIGYDSNLYDAQCEFFVGFWTSRAKWEKFYLKTILAKQHEINISRLHSIPSLFTRRAFVFYYNRCKYLVEDLREKTRRKS